MDFSFYKAALRLATVCRLRKPVTRGLYEDFLTAEANGDITHGDTIFITGGTRRHSLVYDGIEDFHDPIGCPSIRCYTEDNGDVVYMKRGDFDTWRLPDISR